MPNKIIKSNYLIEASYKSTLEAVQVFEHNATTCAALEAIERDEGLEETSLSQLTKDWDNACRT